eukprot:SAG22_NODE_2093_length_3020_cov_8.343033_4_plen_164_part_00
MVCGLCEAPSRCGELLVRQEADPSGARASGGRRASGSEQAAASGHPCGGGTGGAARHSGFGIGRGGGGGSGGGSSGAGFRWIGTDRRPAFASSTGMVQHSHNTLAAPAICAFCAAIVLRWSGGGVFHKVDVQVWGGCLSSGDRVLHVEFVHVMNNIFQKVAGT